MLRILPDDRYIETDAGETVLQASLRAHIQHAHACGGHARCSTCRVLIIDGVDRCASRTPAEAIMAKRIGLDESLRLACQTRIAGDVTVRRLVLDDEDLLLADQRSKAFGEDRVGVERQLSILFADVQGFTAFSEPLPPYDVIHVLNRYFRTMGAAIDRFDGRIDNYMGDGLMALFDVNAGAAPPALRAVRAGLDMLMAMDALQPYLQMAYGRGFDIRVGIHCGEAVVGTVGEGSGKRVTAIGDAVNFASRIESANKITGSRLLISEATFTAIGSRLRIGRSHRLALPGKHGEHTLYEIAGLA